MLIYGIFVPYDSKNNKNKGINLAYIYSKYKTYEFELSPKLLAKLFDFIRANPGEDYQYIINNLIELSHCDDTLTLDEFEMIITKPVST